MSFNISPLSNTPPFSLCNREKLSYLLYIFTSLLKLHFIDSMRCPFIGTWNISTVYTSRFGNFSCYLLKHFNHLSHCGASYWDGAGTMKPHTQYLADFFPVFGVQCRINHMIQSFMFQHGGNPFHQITFTILWINWGSSSYQLQKDHTKAIYVTFLIHTESVRVLCT